MIVYFRDISSFSFSLITYLYLLKSQPFLSTHFHKKAAYPSFQRVRLHSSQNCSGGISHYSLNCLIIQTVCLFKTLIINKILYALHEILSFPLQPYHLMQASAIRFGNAINALKISAIFHTAATVIYGPINTARIYSQRYPFTTALLRLNRYSTHRSP